MAKQYFKLGPKANSFSDPISGLKLLPGKAGQIIRSSNKITKAISTGHIIEIGKNEFDAMNASSMAKAEEAKAEAKAEVVKKAEDLGKVEDLNDLSKAQLQDRVKGLPGISDEEVKSTRGFNKSALIAFIEGWDEEAEEEEEEEDEEAEEEEEEEDED